MNSNNKLLYYTLVALEIQGSLSTDEGKLDRNHDLGVLYYRETIYDNTIDIVSPCLFTYHHLNGMFLKV